MPRSVALTCPRPLGRSLPCLAWALWLVAGCGDDGGPGAQPPADVDVETDADDTDASPEDVALDGIVPGDIPDEDVDGVDTDDADAGPDADATDPSAWCEPAGAMESFPLGEWTVGLHPSSGSWELRDASGRRHVGALQRCDGGERDALVRLATGEPGFRSDFGRLDVWWFGNNTRLTWHDMTGPGRLGTTSASSLEVTLPFAPHGDATLRFELTEHGDVEVRLLPPAPVEVAVAWAGELRWDLDPGSLFGLGAQVTTLDLRGRTYPLHVQEQGNGKPPSGAPYPLRNIPEAAYAPMGVLHAESGWSGLVSHDAVHEIELGSVADDRVALRAYPEPPGFVFVAGDDGRARIASIARYIGTPPEPPDWIWLPWNDTVGGPHLVRRLAAFLRDEAIPSSAIWAEDWIGGQVTPTGFRLSYAWRWNEERYPDLPDLIDELHAGGFSFLAYFNTFVPNNIPGWQEGVDGGFLVERPDGTPFTVSDPAFRTTGLVDLTNPGAAAWMGEAMRVAAEDLGIDGWMADFTEWMPVDGVLHSGVSGWAYRNQWPLDFQRLNRRVLDDAHPVDAGPRDYAFFARSGWASRRGGTAGIVPAMWMGDQMTSFDREDGLATIVPIGAHLGLSGVAVVGSDIAGYQSLGVGNTTKELFLRWTSLGALHPLMRTHQGSDKCVNWTLDRDDETIDHYRRWATVHTLLLPEWRRLHALSRASGLPIVRHPWLVEPTRRALWTEGHYAFFIGDDLLVTPVLERGGTRANVRLPGPGWWPLFGDAPYALEDEVDELAPATELPVHVRPGTALVLLAAPILTTRPAPEGVPTLADVADRARVHLYPDGTGAASTREQAPLQIEATALPDAWGTLLTDETALAVCDEAAPPCLDAHVLRVPGGRTDLRWADGATLLVEADGLATIDLALGGRGWPGGVDEAPETVDLDAAAPPTCDVD